MSKLRVIEFLSVDGVMQSPGSPDEDRDGGFELGGWAPPYVDEVITRKALQGIAETGAYLFGRTTFEALARYWPTVPDSDPGEPELMPQVRRLAHARTRGLRWPVLFWGSAQDPRRRTTLRTSHFVSD